MKDEDREKKSQHKEKLNNGEETMGRFGGICSQLAASGVPQRCE